MSSITTTLTQMQSETNRVNYERGRANLGKSNLDKAGFLQLLMAQLQNQDPTNPVDNAQFVSQQAQFTQIDQMNELTKSITSSNQINQASSLVGKYVEVGYTPDGYTEPVYQTAKVNSVVISNGTVGLNLAGSANANVVYKLDQVTKILDGPPAT